MSFETRKILPRQEIVQGKTLKLDGCKYATPAMLAARTCASFVTIAATGTGQVITLSLGNAELFGPTCYAKLDGGEIVAVTVTSLTQFTITARAQFGTTAAALNALVTVFLMHQGEADGTCFGFPQTCSSADSYDATVKRDIVFTTAPLPAGTIYTNGLDRDSIRREGPEVHPGKDLGTRARLSFTIDDEDDETDQLNPYRDRICATGQKLAKLLERCPHWGGRKVEFREGLRNAGTLDAPEYQTRGYVIDQYNLDDGKLKVSCLDPLILTEDKKSKTPPASEGKLTAAITGTPSTFVYTGADDYHYGASSATVYVRIDSEVIKCTVTGVKTLTVTTRGYRSDVKDHALGATIQLCDVFPLPGAPAENHVIDAIVWILENRTTVPAEYIDDYSATKLLTPSATLTEAILTKPVESAQRINDLIRIGNLIFYFDEITQKIVIDYVPELSAESVSIDDLNHIGKESITVDQNRKQQYTRFSYFWAPYDVTKDSDEYFQIVHTGVNVALESDRYLGAPNERPPERNAFLTDDSDDSLLGVSYVSRMLDESAELPTLITFKLDAENIGATQGGVLAPGRIISVQTRALITTAGDQLAQLFQIERISGTLATGYTVKARKYLSIQPDDVDFVLGTSANNFDLSTVYAPAAGAYTIFINSDVVFGSTSPALPAFTTGSQAPGVSFHFIHRGQMLGAGGSGGNGGSFTGSGSSDGYYGQSGAAGSIGGDAFEATVDCTIDCGSGVIWAGGGGQGGQSSSANYSAIMVSFMSGVVGNGGGGARGFVTTAGGAGGLIDVVGVYQTGSAGVTGGPASYGGGDWGQVGPLAVANSMYEPGRALGGAAGKSIKTNGNTVSITAGNTPTNIKGLIV